MSTLNICFNKRKCADCGQYKSTVSGCIHNPSHGLKLFVCRECAQKLRAG